MSRARGTPSRGQGNADEADCQDGAGGSASRPEAPGNRGTHPVAGAEIGPGPSGGDGRGVDVLPACKNEDAVEDHVPDDDRERDPKPAGDARGSCRMAERREPRRYGTHDPGDYGMSLDRGASPPRTPLRLWRA